MQRTLPWLWMETIAPPVVIILDDVGEVELVFGTGKDVLDKDIARDDGEEEIRSSVPSLNTPYR